MMRLIAIISRLIEEMEKGSLLSVQVSLHSVIQCECKDDNPLLSDLIRAWTNLLNEEKNRVVVRNLMLRFRRRHCR